MKELSDYERWVRDGQLQYRKLMLELQMDKNVQNIKLLKRSNETIKESIRELERQSEKAQG